MGTQGSSFSLSDDKFVQDIYGMKRWDFKTWWLDLKRILKLEFLANKLYSSNLNGEKSRKLQLSMVVMTVKTLAF